MPRMRSRLKSRLVISAEKTAILAKIKTLYDQRASRLMFEVGTERFDAQDCTAVTFDPTLGSNPIQFQRPNSGLTGGGKEESLVTCIADTGALERTDILCTDEDENTTLHEKFFILQDEVGSVAFWYDVGGGGVEPSHGADRSVEITTVTAAMTAAQVATETAAAVHADAKFTATVVTSTTVRAVSTTLGNKTNGTAGDSGFTVTQQLAGAASPLQNTYFVFNEAGDDTSYYAWLNVNGEGVDPAVVGKTAIPVAIAAGATAAAIATALAAAVDAQADFVATASGASVTIANAVSGPAVDIADTGSTGFTVAVLGQLEMYELSEIVLIKRLRNKKWLIKLADSANPAEV